MKLLVKLNSIKEFKELVLLKEYFSEKLASKICSHESKKRKIKLRYYRCEYCNWFHLTSKPQQK